MVSFKSYQVRQQSAVPCLPESWWGVFQHRKNRAALSSHRHQASHRSLYALRVRCQLTGSREIERLEAHVKELENELTTSRKNKAPPTPRPTPKPSPSPPLQSPLSTDLDPMESHQGNRRQWQGMYTMASQSREVHLSGPTSTSYFRAALDSHISSSLQTSLPDFHMQPSGASKFLASPTISRSNSMEAIPSTLDSRMEGESNLSQAQEEIFLALFWQSYHCMIPVLNEVDFREHYESLWTPLSPSASRKASPLVDIILALCIQYGMTFVPRNEVQQTFIADFDREDSTIAGRALYRRCQTLLSARLENPSIMTLQCQIFSAVYLRNASFENLSHSTVASAIRTAQILGLHHESRSPSLRTQKELHRRLWWTVYTMESMACMALGRPWLAHMSQVSCAPPADDQEVALLSGPSFAASIKDTTWLSYHVHHVKLILAARAVHTAFENKCAQVLSISNQESFYDNAQSLETLAKFLIQSLRCLRTWIQSIPTELMTERRDGGKPFSTDRSALQVDFEAPQWLQRQRLLLELTYHHLMMNLYRPFITFVKAPSSPIPLANSNSISCLNHAMVSTNIILQTLKSTDILNGWHEAYHFQWNAVLTMAGFIFANPVCPPTPTARKTINSAIEVFEIFGHNFAVAASAANVTRDLAVKIDTFLDRFRTGSVSARQTPAPIATSFATVSISQKFDYTDNNNNIGNSGTNFFQVDPDGDSAMSQTVFPGAMGDNFSMDPFSGAEWPFLDTNGVNAEMWPQFGGGE